MNPNLARRDFIKLTAAGTSFIALNSTITAFASASKHTSICENELEIKVTTLLLNYCNSKTMEENPMAKLWAERNRKKENKPLPVGLIGPVIIST